MFYINETTGDIQINPGTSRVGDYELVLSLDYGADYHEVRTMKLTIPAPICS